MSELKVIFAKLKEPFKPEDHIERDVRGGSKWFFVPWQKVRERLDEACPDWQVEYGTPTYLDKYCMVSCKLTIAGITREALGNAEIELLSSSGKDMSRGTPIERAIADAFKNAAEAFGVAAYLDEQSQDKREFTIRYLHSKGDGRGVKLARQNNWTPGNLPTAAEKKAQAAKPARTAKPMPISTEQGKRFWAIARQGGYSDGAVRKLLEVYQITSTKDITTDIYDEICRKAGDRDFANIYNRAAAAQSQEAGT